MKKGNWIKLHRDLQNHWLFQDREFSVGDAWIWLLMNANYKDGTSKYKGKVIQVPRGALHISLEKLARKWGWRNRQQVDRFLRKLEDDNMIRRESNRRVGTIIHIINYDKYQSREEEEVVTEKENSENNIPLSDSEIPYKQREIGDTNLFGQQTLGLEESHDQDQASHPPEDLSNEEKEILRVLKRIPGWRLDFKKDLHLIRDLMVEYPSLDLVEAVKSYATAKLDKPLTKKSNPRSQLRNWCKKSVEFGKDLKQGEGGHGKHRRYSGTYRSDQEKIIDVRKYSRVASSRRY